jgi:hypothetical protein
MPRTLFPALTLLWMVLPFSFSPVHASPLPTVQAVRQGDSITLSNDAISATWSMQGASLHWQRLTNHFTGTSLPPASSLFELVPREGVGAPFIRLKDCWRPGD